MSAKPSSPIAEIRSATVFGLNLAFSVSSFPFFVIIARNQFQNGLNLKASIAFACYFAIVSATVFNKWLPYAARAAILVVAIACMGITGILVNAITGNGTHVGLLLAVLTTVLFGLRAGIAMAAAATCGLAVLAQAHLSGYLVAAPGLSHYALSTTFWARRVLEIGVFMTVLTSVVGFMQARLFRLAREQSEHVAELQATMKRLREEEANRKKAERMALESQKLESLGVMAGGIAHDFNNCLQAILGYTAVALEETPLEGEARDALGRIDTAANRAKDLVRQILAFSRKGEGDRTLVFPHLIVKEALELIRGMLPTTIEIREDIDSSCGSIAADATQIHQVIMNLCINAYHAMQGAGGELHVILDVLDETGGKSGEESEARRRSIRLRVRDTGHGMDEETLTRIFDPFFTTKEVGKGTGLGLAMVHGIVKSHGGQIEVESEVGRGTTITVLLPRIDSSAPRPEEKAEPAEGKGERILYVDDEDAIARLGEKMLASNGYQVSAFTGSLAALEAIRARPDDFDLVITDQNMPHMTGFELAQRISEINSDIPVILMSGHLDSFACGATPPSGIRKTLLKPISRAELNANIRLVLDADDAT